MHRCLWSSVDCIVSLQLLYFPFDLCKQKKFKAKSYASQNMFITAGYVRLLLAQMKQTCNHVLGIFGIDQAMRIFSYEPIDTTSLGRPLGNLFVRSRESIMCRRWIRYPATKNANIPVILQSSLQNKDNLLAILLTARIQRLFRIKHAHLPVHS